VIAGWPHDWRMSKCNAPTVAFHTPTPPRKTRQSSGLSFDELTSIDFVSLLDQQPGSGLSAAHDDDGVPATAVSDMPSTHRPDNPLTRSFDAPFFSIAAAAVWLHVSLAILKRLLLKGSLPFVRVGARRKIPFSALRLTSSAPAPAASCRPQAFQAIQRVTTGDPPISKTQGDNSQAIIRYSFCKRAGLSRFQKTPKGTQNAYYSRSI